MAQAEDILWRRLPSNAAVIRDLEARRLCNEQSLPEMRALLAVLGYGVDELDELKIIHVAGSKGKGSTAAFIEAILRRHGLRTALFTSPHLVHPRERLRLNGRSLSLEDFSRAVVGAYGRLAGRVARLPGLFRFMTLLAFDRMLVERRAGRLDVAVVEVGMGGRYDSTNIIERPIVTAITSLTLEHVRSLGPTLASIAGHKAGIAKPHTPLFTVPQEVEAAAVILAHCRSLHSPVSFVESLEMELPEIGPFALGIEGEHQRLNAALAVRTARCWLQIAGSSGRGGPSELDPQLACEALKDTRWPGRHQIVRESAARTWYIDGAHTHESVQYAVRWFDKKCLGSPHQRILLFHVSHDRDYELLLAPLVAQAASFDHVYFVRPASPLDPPNGDQQLELHQQMAKYWSRMTGRPAHAAAACNIMAMLPVDREPQRILVTGSLYLAGEALRLLNVSID